MQGDQLIACAEDALRVRGRFQCLAMENVQRRTIFIRPRPWAASADQAVHQQQAAETPVLARKRVVDLLFFPERCKNCDKMCKLFYRNDLARFFRSGEARVVGDFSENFGKIEDRTVLNACKIGDFE